MQKHKNNSLGNGLLQDTSFALNQLHNFKGKLLGNNVIISNTEEAYFLWHMGSYGVGSLSRRGYREKLGPDNLETSKSECGSQGILEELVLTLEEAMFLCYCLGCLIVQDPTGKDMTIDELWTASCSIFLNFPVSYCVYHHFKCKGWIVKDGTKYGGNFVLYASKPEVTHSQYIVMNQCLWEDNFEECTPTDGYCMENLTAIERIATNTSKIPLICTVFRPRLLTNEKLASVSCLSEFAIKETIMKRWTANMDLN